MKSIVIASLIAVALVLSSWVAATAGPLDCRDSQAYTKAAGELDYIGMPVGGLNAGQVYLGGDGKLWQWDIFNVKFPTASGTGGDAYYVKPARQIQRFEQGFAIRTIVDGASRIRTLDARGFESISFTGRYPIGTVDYADSGCPVSVRLDAFSPFIPTDIENSSLPATVLQYTVKNTSDETVQVELAGWMENPVAKSTVAKGQPGEGVSDAVVRNRIVTGAGGLQFQCSAAQRKSSDDPNRVDLHGLADYGDMTLALLDGEDAIASACIGDAANFQINSVFKAAPNYREHEVTLSPDRPVGGIVRRLTLKPGQSECVTFALSWHFPNVHAGPLRSARLRNADKLRHHYATKFHSASDVADYIAGKREYLFGSTRAWRDTWYDSTLPVWFLNRTFLNISTLATIVSYRLDDLTDDPFNEGRHYCWEGVYHGVGNCTHVLHYEQALGRIFPNLSRSNREKVDYGLSFLPNGVIAYRGEVSQMGHHYGSKHAIDGHCGTILRAYRDHAMSVDDAFLRRNWSRIKQSIQILIDQDKAKSGTADGVMEGPQYNTLDRVWYGKIPWISTLYCAALRAGGEMASDVGDGEFARQCARIADLGRVNIPKELFNGEYFEQVLDPEKLYAPNHNKGCHIDQLMGQAWAGQVGLDRVVPLEKSRAALASIFKYNFHEDVNAYYQDCPIKVKRRYWMPGEAGAVMVSFPRGGADQAPGQVRNDWEKLVVGYFSECWTGQEHLVAALMIQDGLVDEGLTIVKAVDDRYHPSKRNPYNEVEYGNHYTRAMSSYAPFVSIGGFRYHGPKGIIGFAPKVQKDCFRSAFITAQGWGSFHQRVTGRRQAESIEVRWGALRLARLDFEKATDADPTGVTVCLNDRQVGASLTLEGNELRVQLDQSVTILKDQTLSVRFSY